MDIRTEQLRVQEEESRRQLEGLVSDWNDVMAWLRVFQTVACNPFSGYKISFMESTPEPSKIEQKNRRMSYKYCFMKLVYTYMCQVLIEIVFSVWIFDFYKTLI